jgi:hypothetical protein
MEQHSAGVCVTIFDTTSHTISSLLVADWLVDWRVVSGLSFRLRNGTGRDNNAFFRNGESFGAGGGWCPRSKSNRDMETPRRKISKRGSVVAYTVTPGPIRAGRPDREKIGPGFGTRIGFHPFINVIFFSTADDDEDGLLLVAASTPRRTAYLLCCSPFFPHWEEEREQFDKCKIHFLKMVLATS